MKTLHFHIYNKGNVGVFNILMSVECAVLIAKLTKRDRIVFYFSSPIFNSEKKLNIFDLFDVKFPFAVVTEEEPEVNIPAFPSDFHSSCFYYENIPTKDFLNGRTQIVDLKHYEELEDIRTLNSNTLAFYSYLIYFPNLALRKKLLKELPEIVSPKQEFVDTAKGVVDQIITLYGKFNSVHVRRGDYLYADKAKNKEFVLNSLPFPTNEFLVIHTDEKDESFFDEIKKVYVNSWLVDSALPQQDNAEKGLVSMLIASYSNDFIGTLFSTFTSYIQRYRMYKGLPEEFKFLFSQRDELTLSDYRMKESISHGENSWNRTPIPTELKNICFWFREWKESFPSHRLERMQNIRVIPDFLTEEEIQLILTHSSGTNEYFSNENRNRNILKFSNSLEAEKLARRACEALDIPYENIEGDMQIFTQYKGGQTFLHTDSIFEDSQGRRIASILFYLNDDFTGSYIDFPYIGTRIAPQKGMMIAYPLINEFNEQDVRYSHSASVLTQGTKVMSYFSLKEHPLNK